MTSLRRSPRVPEADTQSALDRLVAAGLVFQRGSPPAADYQFKHALVQDTAYGTLLRGPRQALHGRIAAAIETRAPDRVEREPEILAYHLAEAGQFQRAASFLLEAGRRAAARSANLEAVAHLSRGDRNAGVAARRLRARATGTGAATGGWTSGDGDPRLPRAGSGIAAYRRARELAETLGDNRSLFAALWGLWLATGQSNRADYNQQLVDELFRVAEPLNDPGLELQAHHCGLGDAGYWRRSRRCARARASRTGALRSQGTRQSRASLRRS